MLFSIAFAPILFTQRFLLSAALGIATLALLLAFGLLMRAWARRVSRQRLLFALAASLLLFVGTQLLTSRSITVLNQPIEVVWSGGANNESGGPCYLGLPSSEFFEVIPGAKSLRCPVSLQIMIERQVFGDVGWPWHWLTIIDGPRGKPQFRLCFSSRMGVPNFACFAFPREELPAFIREILPDIEGPTTIRTWSMSGLLYDTSLILGGTFLIVGLVPVLFDGWRRWRGFGHGHCRKCGYDLRGLPEPRCPECGRAFDARETEALSPPSA